MAELNQNFTIHDLDKFKVRFSVLDNVSSLLQDNDERVWWGVATSATATAANVKIQKTNAAWSNTGTYPSDYGDVTVASSYIDIEVKLNSGSAGSLQRGSINISLEGDYTSDATFYHELVYSGVADTNNSNVIATGTITVKPSMFTKKGYRK